MNCGVMKIKNFFKGFGTLIDTLLKFIEDIFIISGVFIINLTTYKVSPIAGSYVTGITFLILGIYFAKNPLKKRGWIGVIQQKH